MIARLLCLFGRHDSVAIPVAPAVSTKYKTIYQEYKDTPYPLHFGEPEDFVCVRCGRVDSAIARIQRLCNERLEARQQQQQRINRAHAFLAKAQQRGHDNGISVSDGALSISEQTGQLSTVKDKTS